MLSQHQLVAAAAAQVAAAAAGGGGGGGSRALLPHPGQPSVSLEVRKG